MDIKCIGCGKFFFVDEHTLTEIDKNGFQFCTLECMKNWEENKDVKSDRFAKIPRKQTD